MVTLLPNRKGAPLRIYFFNPKKIGNDNSYFKKCYKLNVFVLND